MGKLRLSWSSAVCLLAFFPCRGAAQLADPAAYSGKRIASVRFEPPRQPLSDAQLARSFPLKSGSVLTAGAVRAAIKSLYGTGHYTDVEVSVDSGGPGGVALVVRTKDQWFVGPVDVQGKINKPPNRGQLSNATTLQLGQPFNDDDLRGAVQGMQSLLQRNGLYGATIEPRVTRDPEHQQTSVTFVVKTGKRARFTTPNVTGDTRIPAPQVAKAAKYKGWFRWKPATNQDAQAGAKNARHKYEKQNRLTASVRLSRRDYDAATNTVKPTLNANGGPKVKINVTGGTISKGKLKSYVPVFDEQTVNRDLLVQGAGNLHDYFQSAGYFDAEVDFRIKDAGPDEQDITYVLELGPRHKLVSVAIQGNHYFRRQDIRERMYLQPSGFIRLRHGRYSESFVRRDKEAIESLYKANGFRDVKVTATSIDDYKGKTGNVAVTVKIEEGPQYSVSSLTLEGFDQLDKKNIAGNLALSPGEPFSEANVAMDSDYILRTYQAAGFPDATFDWKMTPAATLHQVDIHYQVTEGMREFVRDLLVTGLTHTRRSLVDPALHLHAGDPLSWVEMGAIQRNLYELGVFDTVDMAIQNPDGETQDKYVVYHLTEGHRYSVAVGLGAEIAEIGGSQYSLDNPQGQTGFSPRGSFEISRLDMFGLGQSLNFKSRVSSLDDLASLNYLIPRIDNVEGRDISVTLLYDNERDVRTFASRRLEGDLQLAQKLSKSTRVFWRYSYRDSKVDPGTLKINPLLIPLYSQPALIGEVSANLVQDRRDNAANAHHGIYNTVDVGVSTHLFGSRQNFGKILIRSSYYHPIKGNLVLASNTEFGFIAPFGVPSGEDASEFIPLPERFFGGGGTSERGFPEDQAGPRDSETGFPLGGNALLFHSTELRFPLIGDNIGGVLFHDMGNVYSTLRAISFGVHQTSLTDFDYMNHAVGFGIRYQTPLGPVRVDLAYSINPPRFNGLEGTYDQLLFGGATRVLQSVSHFQFFFSIGQAF
jgi:outer membrane protein insertion porin family